MYLSQLLVCTDFADVEALTISAETAPHNFFCLYQQKKPIAVNEVLAAVKPARKVVAYFDRSHKINIIVR